MLRASTSVFRCHSTSIAPLLTSRSILCVCFVHRDVESESRRVPPDPPFLLWSSRLYTILSDVLSVFVFFLSWRAYPYMMRNWKQNKNATSFTLIFIEFLWSVRNFHKNEKVVFLSFSVYSSSPSDPNTLGRDNVVQIDVQDVHLNVGAGERGGTGGCGGRGGACASCLTLPLKQNKKKKLYRGNSLDGEKLPRLMRGRVGAIHA